MKKYPNRIINPPKREKQEFTPEQKEQAARLAKFLFNALTAGAEAFVKSMKEQTEANQESDKIQ